MFRRVILSSAVLIPLLVGVPLASSSASPNVVGTGIAKCTGGWTGSITFSSPLVNGGTHTTEGINLVIKMPHCGPGTPPASPVPTSGKLVAKGVVSGGGANNCGNYFAPSSTRTWTFTSYGGSVVWAPTGINASSLSNGPSVISFASTTLASRVVISVNPEKVTGSYPTVTSHYAFSTTKLLGTILSAGAGDCGNPGGLTTLAIYAATTDSGRF